jgi:tetratricopeptide (TPR) repeat protein
MMMITINEHVEHMLAAVCKDLENNPNNWEAWAAKADILFSIGMYGISIRCCDRSLAINPDNELTWMTKGNLLYKLGRHEDADAAFAKAKGLKQTDYSQNLTM